MVFIRKLWSLSLVPRVDIISTYLKILEDVPQWYEDDEDGHCAGEMAFSERTWVSFNNFTFVNLFFNAFIILDWSSC